MRQAAGASAIHSAEAVSIVDAVTLVENEVPEVLFLIATVTVFPRRLTFAETMSPGLIAMERSMGGSGNSWYHAECDGNAFPEQSADVPICSRALEARSAPPIPTQKAAELCGRLQTMRGSTHVPRTSVNAFPPA
jgi:hypothetical protein